MRASVDSVVLMIDGDGDASLSFGPSVGNASHPCHGRALTVWIEINQRMGVWIRKRLHELTDLEGATVSGLLLRLHL